jgi:hypothetical protein
LRHFRQRAVTGLVPDGRTLTKRQALICLADLIALKAVLLVPGASQTVFRFNALPVRAGIFVVIDFTVLRRVFRRVRMVCRYFSHYGI